MRQWLRNSGGYLSALLVLFLVAVLTTRGFHAMRPVLGESTRFRELSVDRVRLGAGTSVPEGKVKLSPSTSGTVVKMNPPGTVIEVEGSTLYLDAAPIVKSGDSIGDAEACLKLKRLNSTVAGVYFWSDSKQGYWIKLITEPSGTITRVGLGLGPIAEVFK